MKQRSSSPKLPHFLIIGAMKCGTTTLYYDLLTNPAIFLPREKEPNNLLSDEVLTAGGVAAYQKHFAAARPEQVMGEASTRYSKVPDHPGVPARAREVLGPNLKIIYVMREPIARILSHHHHELNGGSITQSSLEEAIVAHPQMINWTRYATQARAWIDVFGREHLCLLRFEDFVADRRAVTSQIASFLGVEPRPELVQVEVVHNKSDEKPVATGTWRRLIHSHAYRSLVRPLLSNQMKNRMRQKLLPRASIAPQPPRMETIDLILSELREEMIALQQLMHLPQPVWDVEAARARYGSTATAGGRP